MSTVSPQGSVADCLVLLDALSGDLAAPHLIDVEVMSALRGLVIGGKLQPDRAREAVADFFGFAIERHEVHPLADRIWDLRDRFTTYDATSLVLAEALGVPLMTCDAKLLGFGGTVLHVP